QTQFLRQVGRPAKGLVDPIFDDALLPHSVETAIQQGVDNHPEIKAAMLDMEAARQEVRREKVATTQK
nr:agglutination protein [Vibrio cholerae]